MNRLSRAHERCRRQTTDDRQTTDGRALKWNKRQTKCSNVTQNGYAWSSYCSGVGMPYFNERNEFIVIYSIMTFSRFQNHKSGIFRMYVDLKRLQTCQQTYQPMIRCQRDHVIWPLISNNRQRYSSTDFTEDYVFGRPIIVSAYNVQIRLCERYNGSTLQSCCTRLLVDFSNISTMPVQSRDSRSSFSNGWTVEQTASTTVSTRRMPLTSCPTSTTTAER